MDDEIQDLRLLINVALQTNKALGMRLDAQAIRIDQLEKRLNELEDTEEGETEP